MTPSQLQQRRTHNLLLISKLLNQRDATSPFTLVLDSLEQAAYPLLREFARRAQAASVRIVFVSFETVKTPDFADAFISAGIQALAAWQREVLNALKGTPAQRSLIIFDGLNSLAATEGSNLAGTLPSLMSPTTSVMAVYHTDVPTNTGLRQDPYTPSPLVLLKYLATSIFTVYSLHHLLAQKTARERSRAEPVFGLDEGVDGKLQSIGANTYDGIAVELEHRRKSGRGVRERYFLPLSTDSRPPNKAGITLLVDHPMWAPPTQDAEDTTSNIEGDTTFELGLTDQQRQDRAGVVLPYFDAQKGGGDGGKILYDMGSEDDFDEEEDEI